MHAVRALQLHKCFRGPRPVTALDGVDLGIQEGEIYGLLGPNGAGKTTLIAILLGLVQADRGSVQVCGLDLAGQLPEVQRRVNLVRGFSGVVPHATVLDLMRTFALVYGAPSPMVERSLRRTSLWARRHETADTLSSGWRQRFFFAKALLNEPQVLFLDEPTVGLDVGAALAVRALIRDLNREGCTVLLTTHHMQEAEALCGRIGLIAAGRVVAEGTAAELKARMPGAGATLEDVLLSLAHQGLEDADD